jgi:hypothetical protein
MVSIKCILMFKERYTNAHLTHYEAYALGYYLISSATVEPSYFAFLWGLQANTWLSIYTMYARITNSWIINSTTKPISSVSLFKKIKLCPSRTLTNWTQASGIFATSHIIHMTNLLLLYIATTDPQKLITCPPSFDSLGLHTLHWVVTMFPSDDGFAVSQLSLNFLRLNIGFEIMLHPLF